MALRFRTRLNLTISSVVFLVVTGMTLAQISIMFWDTWMNGWTQGTILTELTNPNIGHGITSNDRSREFVDEQLIFQAILTSELSGLILEDGTHTPEDLSHALRRSLHRAEEELNRPFTTEITVTDTNGIPIVSTAPTPPTFDISGDIPTQSGSFRSLLQVDSTPVNQKVQPRDLDKQSFKYVGVRGADIPRIVQVGVAGEAYSAVMENFEVQNLLERFMVEDEYRMMMIMDPEENILAETESIEIPQNTRNRINRMARQFLKKLSTDDTSEFDLEIFGNVGSGFDVGIVTPIPSPDPDTVPHVLFILHSGEKQAEFIGSRFGILTIIGAVLFIFALITSIFLSRGLSKPLMELSKGAREFGKGNLNYRMKLKRKDEFNDLAQSFNTMAISIQEYMHVLEEETGKRERLESEFRIAAEMQQMLLPERPPEISGLELIGWNQASKQVGGDFYDFLELEPGVIGLVVGDATGKGVPAALLTTQCASVLRTYSNECSQAGELLKRTNKEFFNRIGSTHKFVTLFLAVIDTRTGKVQYASAGHPPPALINMGTGNLQWMTCENGFPLGIVKDAEYKESSMILQPGDTLVIYSDGFTEAHNKDNELYGDDRIVESLKRSADAPLQLLFETFRDDTMNFMDSRDPSDDMTLIMARYTGLSSQ
jgi:serine phosphatase RsbU (regulator of sigma subunit)